MRLPSKITSYKESSLSKYSYVLNMLKKETIGVLELYNRMSGVVSSLDEYVEILDGLYALHAIDFNKERGELIYVKRN